MKPQCHIQCHLNPNLWHHIDAKLFYFLPVVEGTKALAASGREQLLYRFCDESSCWLFSWWLKLKKTRVIGKKQNKDWLFWSQYYAKSYVCNVTFFHFSSQNQKNVVFTLLWSVCSAVKKARAEREASDFLCCTGNSQESQPARQHAGRCAVGWFVFSWAVIEGLNFVQWQVSRRVLGKLCRAVRTRVEMEQLLVHFRSSGNFLQTLSQYFQWQQWQELVPGWFKMVWGCLTALPFSHTGGFFCLFCCFFFPSLIFIEKVRCSCAFLKTGALKNRNFEPSLLLPLLHTTRWHFRNPIPA